MNRDGGDGDEWIFVHGQGVPPAMYAPVIKSIGTCTGEVGVPRPFTFGHYPKTDVRTMLEKV